ncbi:GNAT family N-acetyltransferase [Aliikangiella sp. IMCC44359]|uniref:GNAT family N-acetyltransferase n=1 Tax=Aliikangiella sp. IMCC44359 TaxID=3459125 RepID=UPI00403AD498
MMGVVRVSDDKSLLELEVIYQYLNTESYWAKGISKELVAQSIKNSLAIGAYADGRQVGFCRVISDFSTFANLVDVFVLEDFRGQGISKKMMECVMTHPKLQGLRRFMLATFDAHELYARYGFTALDRPEIMMQRYFPQIYQSVTLINNE